MNMSAIESISSAQDEAIAVFTGLDYRPVRAVAEAAMACLAGGLLLDGRNLAWLAHQRVVVGVPDGSVIDRDHRPHDRDRSPLPGGGLFVAEDVRRQGRIERQVLPLRWKPPETAQALKDARGRAWEAIRERTQATTVHEAVRRLAHEAPGCDRGLLENVLLRIFGARRCPILQPWSWRGHPEKAVEDLERLAVEVRPILRMLWLLPTIDLLGPDANDRGLFRWT